MLVGLACPRQAGELKQGSDPHTGTSVCVRGETRLRGEEPIRGSLIVMRISQSLPQPCAPQMAQRGELEFRDSGAIPERGCC